MGTALDQIKKNDAGGSAPKSPGSAPSGGSTQRAPGQTPSAAGNANVRRMQEYMADLSKKLGSTSEATNLSRLLATKTPAIELSPDQIKQSSSEFGSTSIGFAGSSGPDGLWGNRTASALKKISDFASKVGHSITITSEIPNKEAIDASSQANLDAIVDLFNYLEVTLTHPEDAQEIGDIFDKISPELTLPDAQAGKDALGMLSVTSNDLESFISFFRFITENSIKDPVGGGCSALPKVSQTAPEQSEEQEQPEESEFNKGKRKVPSSMMNAASKEVYLQKIAETILSANIIKLAQSDPYPSFTQTQTPNQPTAANRALPTPSTAASFCPNNVSAILHWFDVRSKSLYERAYNRYQKNKSAANEKIAKLKLEYKKTVSKLVEQWARIYPELVKIISKSGRSENPTFDVNTLSNAIDQATGGSSASGDASSDRRPRSGRGGSTVIPGGIGIGTEAGPLADQMDFQELYNRGYRFGQEAAQALRLFPNKFVNIRDWDGGMSWQSLGEQYASPDRDWTNADDQNKSIFFRDAAIKLKTIIKGLYAQWRKSQAENITKSSVSAQNEIYNRWIETINDALAMSSRGR